MFFSIKINHQKLEIDIALFVTLNVPNSIKDWSQFIFGS